MSDKEIRSRGFTVVELLIVSAVLIAASFLFFVQKNNVEMTARDNERKTAINAMHYSLEEVFHKQNNYYPTYIDEKILPSVDPDLLTDPNGNKVGEAGSDYVYQPSDCQENKCKSYTLSTKLENEATFEKDSRD